jgi:RHS repeat-associated protein
MSMETCRPQNRLDVIVQTLRAPSTCALVLLWMMSAPAVRGQGCPPQQINGSISRTDGSTAGPAIVTAVPCGSGGCIPVSAPVPAGSVSVPLPPGPSFNFTYPHPNYYDVGQVAGATCTLNSLTGCWTCGGSFAFSLTSNQGAIDGQANYIPSGKPIPNYQVAAVSGIPYFTNTNGTGYFTYNDTTPNDWGLPLGPTPGPRTYSVNISPGQPENAVPATISSNKLTTVQLVFKEASHEPPPRCACQAPPSSPTPSASGSSGGPATPPGPACTVGNPVSVTTGNVDLDQTDTVVPGLGLGLRFERSYNSHNIAAGRYGVFGPGWTHSYEKRLTFPATGLILLRDGKGQPLFYEDNDNNGQFLPSVPATKESWIERKSSTVYVLNFRRGGSERYEIPSGGTSARLTTLTDASGNATNLGYTSGNLTSISDPGGRQLTLTYVSAQLTGLGGPDGPIATFTYATVGSLGSFLQGVTYADGDGDSQPDGSFAFAYHSTGQLYTVTDGAGKVLETHLYDTSGRAIETKVSGKIEKFVLDYSQPSKTLVTDANGNLTTYEWADLWGSKRIVKISGPCAGCGGSGSQTQEWTYDLRGRVTSHKDGEGNLTKWDYNTDGDVSQVTSPAPAPGVAPHTTQYTYDTSGRIATRTAPNAGLTTWTYVPAGPHTVTETVSAGVTRTTTIDYYANGKMQFVRDPLNRETEFHYNTLGDLDWMEDPLNHRTSFQYDLMGRREKTILPTTTPANDTPTTTYDTLGRVARVTNPNASFWQNTYDGGGRRVTAVDPQGHETHYAYDDYGRLATVTDADGGVTQYGYDMMSNLVFLTDPKQYELGDPPPGTEFRYEDGYNRVTKVVYPGNLEEELSYDLAGRLETRKDRKGVTTTFAYDGLGRLTSKTYSNGSPAATFTYDANGDTGFMTGAVNSADTLAWDFDQAGQMLSEASTRNATTVSYLYYLSGERQKLRLNGADVLTYAYEPDGQLNTLTRAAGVVFDFNTDSAHRRQNVSFPNGTTTEYSYDLLSRLSLIRLKLGATVLNDIAYESNDLNNRTARTENGTRLQYGYDDLSRLLNVNRTLPTAALLEQYTYDRVGNRLSALGVPGAWSYNERNELTSYNGINFTYDLNGNQTNRSGPPNRVYSWDVENRLTRVSENGTELVTFEYDPLGRRVVKTVLAGAGPLGGTRFAYDGEDILFEQGPSGNFTYLHGPGIDEPLARETAAGVRTYYHADGLGSVVKRTDAVGNVIGTQAYGSFGTGTNVPNGYAYTGREWDEEVGQYHYRSRSYLPETARFLSEDPLRHLVGPNFYTYVENNPTSKVDPMGLESGNINEGFDIVPPQCTDFWCYKWGYEWQDLGFGSLRECIQYIMAIGTGFGGAKVGEEILKKRGAPKKAGPAVAAYVGGLLAGATVRCSTPVCLQGSQPPTKLP